MAFDVLDHHDGIVDDQTDRQHDGQQRKQVQGEAEHLHQKDAADQRHRYGHDRHQHRAYRTQKQEDHDDDDQQRIGERPGHLVDRIADILRRIVADAGVEAGRHLLLELVQFNAHATDNVDDVGVRLRKHPREHSGLSGVTHQGVIVLGTQLHIGNVLQPDDRVVFLVDDQSPKVGWAVHIGVGREIGLHQRALGGADRGQVVVGGQRRPDLRRTDTHGGHAVGLQPDAHREGARTEDLDPLHAGNRGQARLYHPRQVIGDLLWRQDL